MRQAVEFLLIAVFLMFGSLSAGQPGGPPGQNKLPAPENVVCPVVIDVDLGPAVAVSADAVPGANVYQVQLTCTLPGGLDVSGSRFDAPFPILIPLPEACEDAEVRVRAVPPPKKPTQPVQAGAPKGAWSETCEVPAGP